MHCMFIFNSASCCLCLQLRRFPLSCLSSCSLFKTNFSSSEWWVFKCSLKLVVFFLDFDSLLNFWFKNFTNAQYWSILHNKQEYLLVFLLLTLTFVVDLYLNRLWFDSANLKYFHRALYVPHQLLCQNTRGLSQVKVSISLRERIAGDCYKHTYFKYLSIFLAIVLRFFK